MIAPTVTEEMLMGTVPEMLAVTEPIWAVPAPMVTVPEMAGRELIVRLFPTVTVPPTVTALARSWVLVKDASEKVTACEAGKFRTETLPVTTESLASTFIAPPAET